MKKWIFSVMLLVLAVIMVACGTPVDTGVKFVTADYSQANLGVLENTESAVKEHFNSQKDKINFYQVRSNANPDKFVSDDHIEPIKIDTEKLEAQFVIAGTEIFIPYFIIDENSSESILVIGITNLEGLKYQKGETISEFNQDDFKVYEVSYKDGSKTDVSSEAKFESSESDWPLTISSGKSATFFEGNANVKVSYNDISTILQVRVDGGEDPIRWETSNWWNKISSYPIGFLAGFFGSLINNSFAIGILITTIIIRTLAWPIYAKSNAMSGKMAEMQPEAQKIEAKYALRQDPQSQQRKQMEMAQLYKKYGVGLSGCLMPFLQMPIFIAMYQVVRRVSLAGGTFASKVSNTMFLGFIDIADDTTIWRFVFAAIVGITMYVLQKLSAKRPEGQKKTGTHVKSDQQQQQEKTTKIMMVVMIGIMVLTATSSTALGFYWIIGNLYSLLQTYVTRKITSKKALKSA